MRSAYQLQSLDGRWVRLDDVRSVVELSYLAGGREYSAEKCLAGHRLSPVMCQYLLEVVPNTPATTLSQIVYSFGRLLEYLSAQLADLSAETFAGFLVWLRGAGAGVKGELVETTHRGLASHVLRFMSWASGVGELESSHVRAARRRFRATYRGFNRRAAARRQRQAISPVEFVRLLRAIRLQLEEARAILMRPPSEQETYDPAAPLLPFVMLLGLTCGVRSAEINTLVVRDVREDGDELHVHAPNKRPARIWMSPGVREALHVAVAWMNRWRSSPAPDDPLLVIPAQDRHGERTLARFDTTWVRVALLRFYDKYFRMLSAGEPVLFSGDSGHGPRRFTLSFVHYRSAGITEAARHERDPEKLRVFARHSSARTTLTYYVRQQHLEWIGNVADRLRPQVELLRMAMANSLAPSEDERTRARAIGGTLLGGHCGAALEGVSCVRATDCRLCSFFRIHPDRREVFVQDYERALFEADILEEEEGRRRDAENRRQFAALNLAVIDRIDEFLEGAR